jgi:TonB family protein
MMTPRSHWLVAVFVAAVPALAQNGVTLPVGQNLRERPDQAADVVLEIKRPGTYSLNGRPVAAPELASRLATLMTGTPDHVVYIRADAHLPSSAIDSAAAIVARGDACVAALVGTQKPFTVSDVSGDAGQGAGNVRRAIDMQLPLLRAPRATIAQQEEWAIVLEVLPGPAYRVNKQAVPQDSLQQRLLQIYNPRPLKVLYVRADPAASYSDLFHAMDVGRYAGVVDFVAAPPELTIRSAIPRIDLSVRVTARDDSAAAQREGNIGRCRRGDLYLGSLASAAGAAQDADRVYFVFQVEKQVSPLPGNTAPRYPDALRAARVNGEVLAEFVVDTNGRALPETFKVLKSTHDLFTQAVKAALPGWRFAPASIGPKRVRQLVQMPYNFSVTP